MDTSEEVTPPLPPHPPRPHPTPPVEGDGTTGGMKGAAGGKGEAGEGDADVNVGGALAEGGGPSSAMGDVESPENAPEVEETETHPCLLNEDILDMVFKHVVNVNQPGPSNHVLADIQNFRLVSHPWRNSMTRVYRHNQPVKSFFQWLRRDFWQPPTLTDFVATMGASQMIPVQKYKLDQSIFSHVPTKVLGDFFRICGPEVVSLDMTIEASDAGRIVNALQNALPSGWGMMKMKKLGLHIRQGPSDLKIGWEMGIVGMAGLLLDAGKTLRDFELSYAPHSIYTDPLIILEEDLSRLIASRISTTVRKFTLEMEVTVTGLIFNLGRSALALESFEFRFYSLLDNESLYNFLESQAATLKFLRIMFLWGAYTGVSVRFPLLGELVQLELSDVIVTESGFAKSFPKLNRLEVERRHANDALESLVSSVETTALSVKVLILPMIYNGMPFALFPLNKFAQCFPSLAELHIGINCVARDTLEEIFKYFGNLECLEICFTVTEDYCCVDSIFSGISRSDCNGIEQCPCCGAQTWRSSNGELKKLVVREVYCNWFELTDFCAHFVFLKMEELRELQLPMEVEFSPRYEDLLREKLTVFRRTDGA